MKATQLEQMKEDYTYIITTKNVTLDTVEKHEEVRIHLAYVWCVMKSPIRSPLNAFIQSALQHVVP